MAIVNRLYTPMTNSQTDLTLSNASGFPATSGVVQIDSEKIHYVVSTPSQLLTLTRGYASTSAATHAAGAIVTFVAQDAPAGPNSANANLNDVPIANGDGTSTWGPDTDSGGGITQLTGDVTAGPGSGSVAATLPTVNSNVGSFTNANITVNAKGQVTAAANGSGGSQVLPQVVFATKTTQDSVTGTTYGAVGPTASITLQKSSNKVRVTAIGVGLAETVNSQLIATIKRDSTDLAPNANGLGGIADNSGVATVIIPVTMQWVDSPGDTSSHTYQAFIKCNGAHVVDWGANGIVTTILLEEILS